MLCVQGQLRENVKQRTALFRDKRNKESKTKIGRKYSLSDSLQYPKESTLMALDMRNSRLGGAIVVIKYRNTQEKNFR
jgi:hypothetical protein